LRLTNRRLKWRHRNNRRRIRQLNDGTCKCPPGSQSSECTNGSFATYRGRFNHLAPSITEMSEITPLNGK